MHNTSFNEYAAQLYPSFLVRARQVVAECPLAHTFERLALRLMQVMEQDSLTLPDDADGRIFRLLAVKGVSESRGFLACARDGNMWSAMHHSRALIELLLSSHHLVCDPNKREKRMLRFQEYSGVNMYQHHLRGLEAIGKGEMTDADYEATRLVSHDQVNELAKSEPKWRKLFDIKPEKGLLAVQHWHQPSTVNDLLGELISKELSFQRWPNARWDLRRTYAQHCQATHVSPIAHGLFSRGANLPLVSVQLDPERFMGEVVIAGSSFIGAMARWDEYLVPDARLHGRTRQWLEEFQYAVTTNGP